MHDPPPPLNYTAQLNIEEKNAVLPGSLGMILSFASI